MNERELSGDEKKAKRTQSKVLHTFGILFEIKKDETSEDNKSLLPMTSPIPAQLFTILTSLRERYSIPLTEPTLILYAIKDGIFYVYSENIRDQIPDRKKKREKVDKP